jgi:hypothetical protein
MDGCTGDDDFANAEEALDAYIYSLKTFMADSE